MIITIISSSIVSKKRTIRKRVSVNTVFNARRELFNVKTDRKRHIKLLKRGLVKANFFQLFADFIKQSCPHNRRLCVISVSRNTFISQKLCKPICILRTHPVNNSGRTRKRVNRYFTRSPLVNSTF